MRITAELFPARETKAVELPPGSSGYDLIKLLGLAPDVHLLVREDVPIPIDEKLRDGERVRVIAVVSGG
jgi:sulfur carrier protein ThiS